MKAREWRAVYCRPRQETRAEAHLERQGYQVYLPRIRARRRRRAQSRLCIEPLFPRYLFIALADYRDDWGPIRSTRGVVGLVVVGDQVPVVPREVVNGLIRRHDDQGTIDLNAVTEFRKGDPVEISDGPFAGLTACFDAECGERRVRVLLELLNSQRHVELDRDLVRKTA